MVINGLYIFTSMFSKTLMSVHRRAEDVFLYLCEYLGGALLHFFEMSLFKFLQPHPVALEERAGCDTRIKLLSFFIKR